MRPDSSSTTGASCRLRRVEQIARRARAPHDPNSVTQARARNPHSRGCVFIPASPPPSAKEVSHHHRRRRHRGCLIVRTATTGAVTPVIREIDIRTSLRRQKRRKETPLARICPRRNGASCDFVDPPVDPSRVM